MLPLILAAALSLQSLEDQERALREELARTLGAAPDGPAREAWDQKCFDLEWKYGLAIFQLAEDRRQKALWEQVIRHFTDFIWKRDDYLAALQARIYLSRAHQALQQWGPAFAALAGARQANTPERRKNPELVQIAMRSWIEELRARAAFGRGVEIALDRAREDLKPHAKEQDREPFLQLRLEMARSMHTVGRVAESERTLREIAARHEGTDPGDEALALLADLFQKAGDLSAYAERLFALHHFTQAAGYFGRVPRTPQVWLRLGICYTNMRRLHEAALALREACAIEHPDRTNAAARLEQVLRGIAEIEGKAEARARHAAHVDWMRKTFDAARLGPVMTLILADGLLRDGKYRDAADLYGKLKPGEEGYEGAVHAAGWCRFKLKEYDKAAEAFRAYLGFEKRTPRDTDSAIDLACWSLLSLGKPEEALALTDKAVPADPAIAEWRLAHRVDALGRLARFKEARETLAAMKESVAVKPLIRAMERLVDGYETAIRKGDNSLWGPYARLVLALTEKTFQPLRGERLLAAADALSLEATAEPGALAYDLYGQYLADARLRDDERHPIEYRRAQAAVGAGKLDRALEIAVALVAADPMKGVYQELKADILVAQARKLGPSTDRNRLLDEALATYGPLADLRRDQVGEPQFRVMEKYAATLFLRDPERARDFFVRLEARGWGAWDDGRWGYRAKMDALRKKVMEAVPPRR